MNNVFANAENIDDATLKVIAKHINHPSILAITSEYENRENIFFSFVSKEEVSIIPDLQNRVTYYDVTNRVTNSKI